MDPFCRQHGGVGWEEGSASIKITLITIRTKSVRAYMSIRSNAVSPIPAPSRCITSISLHVLKEKTTTNFRSSIPLFNTLKEIEIEIEVSTETNRHKLLQSNETNIY